MRTEAQLALLEPRAATAPCVPAIREKVTKWRDGGYKGATDTTRLLLNHWFLTEHRSPRKFAYHYFQREALETLIYLYEVAKIRRQKPLIETFAVRTDLKLLRYDDFARYCVKMATGSGKTKVMSLAIAWQYFNAVAEARDDFAKSFLLVAPNVIVFERLRTDFAGGRIFTTDPIIPEELRIYWDFQCYIRGENERAGSIGALYLTNVQQFYERAGSASQEPEAMAATVKTLVEALQKIAVSELEPQLLDAGRALSETPPFPWSRPTMAAKKCIFNLVPCDNEFEKEFARFLDRAEDISRFAKLPEQFGFAIEYTDGKSNLRYYEPDFIALTGNGTHYIVETKGLEDVNVVNKDRAAKLWCENTTRLTGKSWDYLKVLQTEFIRLQPTSFSDLLVLKPSQLV